MNTCARSGYLVDATSTLPADASMVHVERLTVVGCTRIRCDGCGAFVRNVPGLAFRTRADQPHATLSELYDTKDLASSPLLHATEPDFRLYLCRCNRWLESSAHACREPDLDPLTDPQMPWRCAGHPPLEIGTDELREMATRGFSGVVPPGTPDFDAERGDWLVRLRARLAPVDRAVLDSVALTSLQAADAKTRGLAIRYFYITGEEAGARRMFALLSSDRASFAGVPDPVTDVATDKTLEESMWRVIAPLGPSDTSVRSALRAEALSGRAGRSVFSAIAQDDTAWLREHIDDLGRAAGAANVEVLVKSLAQLPPKQPLQELRERARKAASRGA